MERRVLRRRAVGIWNRIDFSASIGRDSVAFRGKERKGASDLESLYAALYNREKARERRLIWSLAFDLNEA